MRRRLAISALAAAIVLLVVGAVVWFVWIPHAIESRLADAASRRGLEARVGSIDAGFSSLELSAVELRSRDVIHIRLESVRIDAGVWGLALSGRAAIGQITVIGGHVALDIEAESLDDTLSALRGSSSTADSGAVAQRPVFDAERLELEVRDRRGALLLVEDGAIHGRREGVLELSTGAITLAPGEDEGVTLASTRLTLHEAPEEEGWRIDSAIARDARLTYRDADDEPGSSVWRRAQLGLRTLRALLSTGVVAGRDESPGGASGAAEAEPSRVAAIAHLARSIGPRLSAGAAIRLEGLEVVASSEDGEAHVLRELVTEARALPGGRYRLEGEGRPGRGGRLGWDLTLDPDALRAEGELNFQRLPFVLLVPFLPDLPWYRPEDATLTGDLSIRGDSASEVHLDGEASLRDLALSSPRIAPAPVRRISASFRGEAQWLPLSRRLEISEATVGMGEAQAQLSGSLEWPEDHFLVDARVTLPPTDCNTAVGAIPADLLAELNGFTFRGQIGGQLVARIDSRELDRTELDVDVADGCTFVTAPALADVRRFESSFIHRVIERDGTEFTMETGPDTLRWTPLSQVSPFLVQAVLGHEDGGFFRHGGFSVPSIRLALIRNLREGRYVYGASTITMQLVKNVFLRREKTLARKVQEVLLTWWVESVMAKTDILQLYLNVIEYGPAIYGIREAAMHYFGRSAATLGPAEAAYIATILPNPKVYHSHWEDNELPAAHRRRVARFVRTLGSRERYDADAVAYALARLEDFHFHRPGDPVPVPSESRGRAGPLPFPVATSVRAWESDDVAPSPEIFDDHPDSRW